MDSAFQAHPVPQNVTNFEFHLVGDMTLKQFGYLAVGLVLAFFTFVGFASSLPLLAWPLIIIFAGVGAAFAFIPIQERPLDHWVAAFFNAIFKPTRLKFSSKILRVEDPLFAKRLVAYFKTHQASAPNIPEPEDQVEKANMPENLTARKPTMADRLINLQQTQPKVIPVFQPLPQMQVPSMKPLQTAPPPSAPSPAPKEVTPPPSTKKPEALIPLDLKKTVELAKEAQETQQQIAKIEQQISQIKQQASQPGVDPRFYVEQFQDLLTDLTKLNKEAGDAAHELAVISKLPANQPYPQQVIPETKPKAPQAPLMPAKSIPTLNLTTFPNVINGIVTDSKGNYIEGAVVVAHDKQGLPVRALKSNKLGQFVAATPLPNGTFSIVVEKENLTFDSVSVELKGDILNPIVLAAKKMVAA